MKKHPRGYVKKLADACSCTAVHMSDVLNGHRQASIKLAQRIETASNGKYFKGANLLAEKIKPKTGAKIS